MGIKGFQGTSLLDFPGRIASLVFYGGCNLTCPFCHNPTLVLTPQDHPDYPQDELLAELRERRTFIDGVVVSGGEPTLDPNLQRFLEEVKALGLQVKLDTNGLAPEVLERLLGAGLVDYVALDLKTAPRRYPELHPAAVDVAALEQSVRLLAGGGWDGEFRTTCVPGLVEATDVQAMGEALRGARRWVLQQYVPQHALAESLREEEPHPVARLRELAELAGAYAQEVTLRGV